MTHVVLFGNLRASLTLARSLARAGHAVDCGVDEPDPYLAASRHVRRTFTHPAPDAAPDAALACLLAYLRAHPEVGAVAPVSDIATRLLARRRGELPPGVRVLAPPWPVVATCIDKAVMFDLCERLGAPLAAREIVTDHAALLAAVERVGRPCIVKPVDASHYLFGRKARILREGDDVGALLPHWPQEHPSLCVQTFVEGFRHDISFAAHRGRLIGAVDCRATRTDRADGTGYTTELVSERVHPEVARGVETLVAALDYTGVGDIEFVLDERSGAVSFIELNPRLSASFKSAEACGLPLSELMLALGLGEAPASRPDPWAHPTGRRVAWTKGEVSGVARELRAGRLGPSGLLRGMAVVLWSLACRRHLTFAATDPLPSVWLYLHPLLRRLGLRHPAYAEDGHETARPEAPPAPAREAVGL